MSSSSNLNPNKIIELKRFGEDNQAWLVCQFCGRAYQDEDSMVSHLYHNHWKREEDRARAIPKPQFMAPKTTVEVGNVEKIEEKHINNSGDTTFCDSDSKPKCETNNNNSSMESKTEVKDDTIKDEDEITVMSGPSTVQYSNPNNMYYHHSEHQYQYQSQPVQQYTQHYECQSQYQSQYQISYQYQPNEEQYQCQYQYQQQQYHQMEYQPQQSFANYNNITNHNDQNIHQNFYSNPVLTSTTILNNNNNNTSNNYQLTVLSSGVNNAFIQNNVEPLETISTADLTDTTAIISPPMAFELEVSTDEREGSECGSDSSAPTTVSTLYSPERMRDVDEDFQEPETEPETEVETDAETKVEKEDVPKGKKKKKKRSKSGRIWECPLCFKRVTQSFNLTIHMRSHTGQKPYECRFSCGKAFISSSHRSRHERVHNGQRPYACSECDLKCSSSWNLKCHKKTHVPKELRSPKKRPFACTFDCGKSFRTTTHRRVHERVHTGERPYACTLCSSAFTNPASLRYHQKVHKSEERK